MGFKPCKLVSVISVSGVCAKFRRRLRELGRGRANAGRPAAGVALIGRARLVLSSIWVWLGVGEVPSALTLAGGCVIFLAITGHGVLALRRSRRAVAANRRAVRVAKGRVFPTALLRGAEPAVGPVAPDLVGRRAGLAVGCLVPRREDLEGQVHPVV